MGIIIIYIIIIVIIIVTRYSVLVNTLFQT